MPDLHRIRLRAPWRFFPAAGPAAATDARWEGPAQWQAALGRDFCGLARCTRVFHAPPRLPEDERLWLVIAWPPAAGRLLLNDVELAPVPAGAPAVAWDITPALRPDNELALELELPPPVDRGSAKVCQVWLEVRSAADRGPLPDSTG